MSETISVEEYKRFLELASTNILKQVGDDMVIVAQHFPDDSPEFEVLNTMLSMLAREYQLREIEPLWRKARRFAIRNSGAIKEVGKIAACIGVGVLLGVSLDD